MADGSDDGQGLLLHAAELLLLNVDELLLLLLNVEELLLLNALQLLLLNAAVVVEDGASTSIGDSVVVVTVLAVASEELLFGSCLLLLASFFEGAFSHGSDRMSSSVARWFGSRKRQLLIKLFIPIKGN